MFWKRLKVQIYGGKEVNACDWKRISYRVAWKQFIIEKGVFADCRKKLRLLCLWSLLGFGAVIDLEWSVLRLGLDRWELECNPWVRAGFVVVKGLEICGAWGSDGLIWIAELSDNDWIELLYFYLSEVKTHITSIYFRMLYRIWMRYIIDESTILH